MEMVQFGRWCNLQRHNLDNRDTGCKGARYADTISFFGFNFQSWEQQEAAMRTRRAAAVAAMAPLESPLGLEGVAVEAPPPQAGEKKEMGHHLSYPAPQSAEILASRAAKVSAPH